MKLGLNQAGKPPKDTMRYCEVVGEINGDDKKLKIVTSRKEAVNFLHNSDISKNELGKYIKQQNKWLAKQDKKEDKSVFNPLYDMHKGMHEKRRDAAVHMYKNFDSFAKEDGNKKSLSQLDVNKVANRDGFEAYLDKDDMTAQPASSSSGGVVPGGGNEPATSSMKKPQSRSHTIRQNQKAVSHSKMFSGHRSKGAEKQSGGPSGPPGTPGGK